MRFRVIAKTADDFEEWLSEQQQGPVNPLFESDGRRRGRRRAGPGAHRHDVPVHQLPHLRRLVDVATYGPNLTHLASRTTFASGTTS